jgi:thiamine biosynthesis lipoprotein
MAGGEAIERFACFGGQVTVIVDGRGPGGAPAAAAAMARRRLLDWHDAFSRFEPGSELARLNADTRESVPASAVMRRLVRAIVDAWRLSGGLVDATLVGEIEQAGYREHFGGESVPLADALAAAPARAPARPRRDSRLGEVSVDDVAGTVTRPPGMRFDSGGLAKGLFGDILAEVLGLHAGFAIDCAGDVRFGGAAGVVRPVQVASPFDDAILHVFELVAGAAATSGIGRRSWLDAAGRPTHHLLDPESGRPAYTGLVQVTALAPTGVEAEARSKAALLRGPREGAGVLVFGGVLVDDDGGVRVLGSRLRAGTTM